MKTYDPIGKILANGHVFKYMEHSVALDNLHHCFLNCRLERSTKRHAAGLRTFIIVSLASTSKYDFDLY